MSTAISRVAFLVGLGVPQSPLRSTYRRRVANYDAVFGGGMAVVGTTLNKASPTNLPVGRRVRLHNQLTGALVREQWSHATSGAYSFPKIAAGPYYVVSFDHTGQFNGVIATNVQAEPM